MPVLCDDPGHEQPTDRPTTATGQAGSVDLAPLAAVIADLTRENRPLAEPAAVWQVRAMQAEEPLKQLTAGQDVTPPASQHEVEQVESKLVEDRPLRGPGAPIGPPAWRTTAKVEQGEDQSSVPW